MKQDIFQQADLGKKKVVNTTMFEIKDGGREYEYNGDRKYIKHFVSFLESLGYEVELIYEHSSYVLINGEEFSINDGNAGYMAKNIYTRNTSVRSPNNRFVGLEKSGIDGSFWVKVYINKEMDADKLRAKINKAIQTKIDNQKKWEETKNRDHNNTVAVAIHFLANTAINNYCRDIYIEKGRITFHLALYGSVSMEASGALLSGCFRVQDLTSIDAIREFQSVAKESSEQMFIIATELDKCPTLDESLINWCETAYHRRFNVAKMEADK